MESGVGKDWKKKIGFPINYDSGQSSDDDFGERETVVVRRPGRVGERGAWRGAGRGAAGQLLADAGDGAEADVLGTTPPRARIRDKEKRRPIYRSNTDLEGSLQRLAEQPASAAHSPHVPERLKKRASLKLVRGRERDHKAEWGERGGKADSLPSPSPAVPTLVESCSRFMSLSSRLKCSAAAGTDEAREAPRGLSGPQLPPSRVNFHSTFSMLINMGNVDKGCKRTISREEQVWQNELKDLIWLALRARLAGRSLAQQDAFLCTQRRHIPAIVQNLLDYKFVNPYSCPCADAVSLADPAAEANVIVSQTCLSPECSRCVATIGLAMREVGALLEAVDAAVALYPSSCAAEADQPCLARPDLKHRIRAMCLWYNTALHMRMKMMSLRRLLCSARVKCARRDLHHLASSDSDYSRKSSVSHQATVRFDVSSTPTDSSGSDLSAHSENAPGSHEYAPQPPQPSIVHGSHESAQASSARGSYEEVQHAPAVAGELHGDVLDSGIDSRSENFGDTTPEIVISGTASPSGGSTCETPEPGDDPLRLGSLHELTRLRLLGKTSVPPYRDYHHEMLKTQGVRRCMAFIHKMSYHMLRKVYLTLLEPEEFGAEAGDPVEPCTEDALSAEVAHAGPDGADENSYVLRRYGCWSPESVAMRLPWYRSHFILLNCICMEAVHDILTLRLDTRPAQPSCLTVKQLIHELKEGLDIATEIRSAFVRHAAAALRGVRCDAGARHQLQQLLGTFDASVDIAVQQYLSYLGTIAETEAIPRAALAGEWAFAARLAARAPRAARTAPAAFVEIACRQLRRLVRRFDDKFAELVHVNAAAESEGPRYMVYALCRAAQQVYAGEREAVLQAAQAARALAARLPPKHRRLRAPLYENLMHLRDCLVRHTENILEKSSGAAEAEAGEWARDVADGIAARVRELLLQGYKLGFELHRELYRLVQPQREAAGARPPRPASLQPPRAPPAHLPRRRPETVIINESFNPLVHKELHRLANESGTRVAGAAGAAGAASAAGAARAAGRSRLARAESVTEDGAFDCRPFDTTATDDLFEEGNGLEDLLPGERPSAGREESVDGAGEESEEGEEAWAAQVARAVIQFARCWMRFVVERCERGRGLRPRWASQGLEFLMLACDPWNTRHLSDEEFEELKQLMDGCISHVIGSRPPAQPEPPRRPRRRLHSPLPSVSGGTSPAGKETPAPASPAADADPPSFQSYDHAEAETQPAVEHERRVREAVARLDAARDALLRERRLVGHALPAPVASYEPKLRQLTFKWQRGLKIGAGTFGKVYTVVNTESGQLLAMKELNVCAGDRRALQRAANELRVLEGVLHPHLVRYYGCELHREEMLLFMELCVEGSLEALLVASGALAEPTVRRYTKQLVSAVVELHGRGIAHRDIKSGNIFLTNEGHCLKLGDFGCAVKIRATTTAPGELQGFVGTQAYMAPEVFMKSSGHGRAADVWSLGCVVTEMASGKRPFSEYDSNYQIMFVVGMGGRPAVPDSLSEEGQEFCALCLTHDPDLRPRADDLAQHHFLMVKSDEDCKCEPAYLMT